MTFDEQRSQAQHLTEQQGQSQPHSPSARIPFSYAKRHGVVLSQGDGAQAPVLLIRHDTPAFAIQEAMRLQGRALPLELMEDDGFDQALTRIYQSNNEDRMQQAEEFSGLDLMSLAESVPETEDLME